MEGPDPAWNSCREEGLLNSSCGEADSNWPFVCRKQTIHLVPVTGLVKGEVCHTSAGA